MENKYGFVQLKTYFEENGDTLPRGLMTQFMNLMSILGKGPGGKNSECQAFGPSGLSTKVLTTLKPMADGTVRQTSEIFNQGTIPSIIELLNESMNGNQDQGDDEPAPAVEAPAPATAPATVPESSTPPLGGGTPVEPTYPPLGGGTPVEPTYPPLGGGTPVEAPATTPQTPTPTPPLEGRTP